MLGAIWKSNFEEAFTDLHLFECCIDYIADAEYLVIDTFGITRTDWTAQYNFTFRSGNDLFEIERAHGALIFSRVVHL